VVCLVERAWYERVGFVGATYAAIHWRYALRDAGGLV
jgi:hypothetical protein